MSGGILAIDAGRVSGWAYGEPGRTPVWGSVTLADTDASGGRILARARELVEALIERHHPVWLCQEKPYIQRPGQKTSIPFQQKTMERLQRLAGVIESIAFERGLSYREPEIRAVAKHFLGREGAALRSEKKKALTKLYCEGHGWKTVTQDAADALALLSYMEFSLSPAAARLRGERLPLFSDAT